MSIHWISINCSEESEDDEEKLKEKEGEDEAEAEAEDKVKDEADEGIEEDEDQGEEGESRDMNVKKICVNMYDTYQVKIRKSRRRRQTHQPKLKRVTKRRWSDRSRRRYRTSSISAREPLLPIKIL